MSVLDLLRRLVGADGGGGAVPDDGPSRPPPRQPPPRERGGRERFEARLRLLAELRPGQPLVAGRLQTLALHNVKAQLGAAWPRTVEKAHRLAQRVIARRMGPEDAWTQVGDDGYVLLFARLSRDEGAFKAASMAREITSLLLGELPDLPQVPVGVVVHEIDPVALEGKLDLPSVVTFFDRARCVAAAAGAVAGGDGAAPPDHQLEVLSLDYLPVWSRAHPDIRIYHCLARRGTAGEREPIHGNGTEPPGLELECAVLRTAIGDVEAMLRRRRKALVIVPIHWHSLTQQQIRRDYAAICQGAPAGAASLLGFAVVGMPEGTWQMSLLQHLPPLVQIARALMVHIDLDPSAVDRLKDTGVRIACLDASGFDPSDGARRLLMAAMVRRAAANRIGLCASGVGDERAARSLRAAGIRLMAGPAIAPPVALPGQPVTPLLKVG